MLITCSVVAFAVETGIEGTDLMSVLGLKETTTPTPEAGIAKLYTKSDDEMYFQDGGGNERKIATDGHAEMYLFENAVEASVEAVDQWHGAGGQSAGSLSGWTFEEAAVATISSFDDYSGTVAGTIKATTSAAHGFTTGDPICLVGPNIAIGGANEYAGVVTVTVVDADEFYFTDPDWNATTTAIAILPDRLVAGPTAFGTYLVHGAGSFTSAGNDKEYDLAAFINSTQSEMINVRVYSKNASEYSTVAGSGTATIAVGDVLWLGLRGNTDDTNATLRNANTFIHRL